MVGGFLWLFCLWLGAAVAAGGRPNLLPLTNASIEQSASVACGSVMAGRSAALLIARTTVMTTDKPQERPGQLLCQASDVDYRTLEHQYHQSAQYAAMVARYPQLRDSIEACGDAELVADAALSSMDPPAVVLHWDRSHGEA